MGIDKRANNIIRRFNQYDDWEDRYRELIQLGKTAKALDDSNKSDKYLVKGCQSLVWLKPSFIEGKVYFQADSDASIVKGIVCLLVEVFSESTPAEIMSNNVEFLSEIGITEHLSMNRTNGLSSMVKQIKMYAIAYQSLAEKGIMNAPQN